MKEGERAAFHAGLKHAVWMFAVWNDGVQYVGVRRQTLKEVFAEIDRGRYDMARGLYPEVWLDPRRFSWRSDE